MKKNPCHDDQLVALRRIEGQVRGVQKMVEEKRYCVDIMTIISSVVGALLRVQDKILEKHLNMCVTNAMAGNSEIEKQKKIEEILALVKKFRKTG